MNGKYFLYSMATTHKLILTESLMICYNAHLILVLTSQDTCLIYFQIINCEGLQT